MKVYFLMVVMSLSGLTFLAASESEKDAAPVKTGWNFGALPAIAYNTDEGFRYGALANFFHFGDGSTFPAYKHSIYLEWSRTTKGNGLNNFFYDSPHLIPDTRTTFDLMYLTEQALDFYGFNGYEAIYDRDREDDARENGSRMFYRHERKLLRITADFQRRFLHDDWKWVGGFGYFGVNTARVDFDLINKGQEEEDRANEIEETLFDIIIPDDLSDGGNTVYLKGGIMHDTRDHIANPMRGLWTEGLLIAAPGVLGNGDFGYYQAIFIHRHYFTLVPNRLSIANRLGYQGKIAGDMPFYMLPFIFSSYKTYDGFGGSKTVRGVRRNRIQGDGVAYGNFEIRYKAVRFNLIKQNFYISTSAFADFAAITQPYDINKYRPQNNPVPDEYFSDRANQPHWGIGLGLHIVMNENFIVAVNYGRALDDQDGDSGVYIGLNFLY